MRHDATRAKQSPSPIRGAMLAGQWLIDGHAGDGVHARAQNRLQAADVEIGGRIHASYTQAGLAEEFFIDLAVRRDIG